MKSLKSLKSVIGEKFPGLVTFYLLLYGKLVLPLLNPNIFSVKKMIGPYGPFKFHPRFVFSDYSDWGKSHNGGFRLCVEECRGKKCVLDLGGHIGLLTMPMSRAVGASGKVYVFEPADENLKYLSSHLKLNGMQNVEIINCLVGSSDLEEVPFYEESDYGGLSSTVCIKELSACGKKLKTQVSVDSFCQKREITPEVIKIDVEGAELDVLSGARETIRKNKPVIFLSYHPKHLKKLGRTDDEFRAMLAEFGYSCLDTENKKPVQNFVKAEYILLACK